MLVKKITKIIARQIYENFVWRMLKKPSLVEKPDCIMKKRGSFVEKHFRHFMSFYDQTSLKNFFSVLNWIFIVFCFLSFLQVSFKGWFPLKPSVLLKLLISTNELLFLSCMCLMNATRKNIIYLLVDEVQCHNKWKIIRVCVCVCVCVMEIRRR